ncbi:MAG: DNA recombination protein RmuC [Bacteroidia bacterium]|nr:DNA recombination protein RmuC [Bacteroidia bacterium]
MIDGLSFTLGLAAGLLTGGFAVYFLLNGKTLRQKTENIRLQATLEARENAVGQLRTEFENLAGRVLEASSQRLSQDNQTTLNHLLQPLKEKITDFEKKVENTYQQEARERFSLQKEVEKLVTLNMQMSHEAQNLTKALRGDSKMQGNWGELVLARVLESSGLREGEEFIVQGKDLQLTSTDGKRLQPDVIIHLPDDKHIIIDAKVTLTAWDRFVSEEDPSRKAIALKQHLESVSTHIHQLSTKHYPAIEGLQSPDFVLMFMPVEPAFALALQHRHDLFAFAWDRKIVLVSPTTLLATLKTVASIWKLEHQNKNAQEIARQGGALYDKFVGFTEEMQKLGKSIERTSQTYSDAMNKLTSGHGNLASRAEKLRELGAKTAKKL